MLCKQQSYSEEKEKELEPNRDWNPNNVDQEAKLSFKWCLNADFFQVFIKNEFIDTK